MTAVNNPQKTLTLAEAVITQAWNDAMVATNLEARSMNDIKESWWFLSKASGPWAQERDFWCNMAGKDESRLRAQAIAARAQHQEVIDAYNDYHEERRARKRRLAAELRCAA